ncbi:hypothetical protein [uncultured Mucilaginibacter sp.]|uniref:hypothetical protein n=1 Tax=uncultured Mucilaginibacter sp. TaxID=797541 RepID=UPI0025E72ABB|nr:hypothetical protein [uncultured Mucilaginibacter sp.]
MAVPIFKSKVFKVILIVLAVLAVLLLVATLGANTFLKPILVSKLKKSVRKATNNLYKIDLKDVQLNVFAGSIGLADITFKADTNVFKILKEQNNAPTSLYTVEAGRVSVSGAKALKYIFSKEVSVQQVSIGDAIVKIDKLSNKTGTKENDKRTLYQKIKDDIKFIDIGGIELNDLQFNYADRTGKSPSASVIKHIDIKAADLLIDSATQADTSRTLFCKNITAGIKNYEGKSASGLYTYKLQSLTLHTQASKLVATGLSLQPLPSAQYFKKSKEDRFDIRLDTVVINKINLEQYYKQNSFSALSIVIKQGRFEVFSNPNGLVPVTDRLVTFPHWAVRQIKQRVKVDTVYLKNINVKYKEYHKKSKKTGSIAFTNTTARFLNITNNKNALSKNNICKAYVHSQFMGKASFNLWFDFNLNDADYKYAYRGHLGAIDLKAVNPAVMPLGMVQITSGNLKSLDFKVTSTQKVSAGSLKFLYNDLKIKLLGQDDKKGYKQKSLLSFFASSLILKSNNPDKAGEAARVATLKIIRPSNFPFFKTIWFTLLNGIKTSAMGKAPKQDEQDKEKRLKEKEKADKKARKQKEKEDKEFRKKLEKLKNKN